MIGEILDEYYNIFGQLKNVVAKEMLLEETFASYCNLYVWFIIMKH